MTIISKCAMRLAGMISALTLVAGIVSASLPINSRLVARHLRYVYKLTRLCASALQQHYENDGRTTAIPTFCTTVASCSADSWLSQTL